MTGFFNSNFLDTYPVPTYRTTMGTFPSYLGHRVHQVARDAEITHFDFAGAGDENVAGLHVPMDDPELGVEVVEGAHHTVRN